MYIDIFKTVLEYIKMGVGRVFRNMSFNIYYFQYIQDEHSLYATWKPINVLYN